MEDNLPNDQDQLFQPEPAVGSGAWISSPANKFLLYSEGYKKAGDALFELSRESSYHNNTIVYPMVFNYRHYCELRLKELISMGYKYLDEPKDFKDEHSLEKLWNVYRNEILIKVEEGIEKKTLDNVERLLIEFDKIDPKSMAFRYPVTTAPKRNPSLQMDTIDIDNFKNVIDRVANFFEWQSDMLSHYSDMKGEMLSDLYDGMI